MIRRVLAVASNTFKEAIRDRILYGFLFFAICLILFSLILGQLSFREEIRAVLDVGMAGISFFSVLMSIFLGISLLNKEIEKRTLYTILSKPISRAEYLSGKFLGLVLTMCAQVSLMVIIWLLVLISQGGSPSLGIVAALFLIIVEVVLVIAMSLFFTSFSSPFLSGLFCLGIFFAGRNAQFISELAHHKGLAWMAPLLNGVSAVLPNFYLFYPSGKLIEESWVSVHSQFVSSGYLVSTLGYGVAYSMGFLLLAIFLLNRRDFI